MRTNYKNVFKAKTVKEENITENVSVYAENKVLYTFDKPRSPITVKFFEDKNDSWIVYVVMFKTKSGIITDTSIIIADDVETRKKSIERMGFILKK